MQKKRSANNARFRAGTTGACEAQLWNFVGAQRILNDDNAAAVHWVAAESLDEALRYMRQRNDDFTITEARFLGMIPLLSGLTAGLMTTPVDVGAAPPGNVSQRHQADGCPRATTKRVRLTANRYSPY